MNTKPKIGTRKSSVQTSAFTKPKPSDKQKPSTSLGNYNTVDQKSKDAYSSILKDKYKVPGS